MRTPITKISRIFTLFFTLTVFLFTACEKTAFKEGEPCSVTVSISKGTKISSSFDESLVLSTQIMVFRQDGMIDAYGHIENGSELTVSASSGQRIFWAFVNAPDLSSIKSLSELETVIVNLEQACSVIDATQSTPVLMKGKKEFTLTSSTTVIIPVEHTTVRVKLDKMSNQMKNDALQEYALHLNSLYLTNVVKERPLIESPSIASTSFSWTNKLSLENTSPIIYKEMNNILLFSESKDILQKFYLFPNGCTEDSFGKTAFTPRHTRVVTEVQMDGKTYYYPVTLPVCKENQSFEIKEMIIARAGSLHPEEPLSYAALVLDIDSVGDYLTDEKGVQYVNAGEQVMVFAPDGVDPFDYLSEYRDMTNAGNRILLLNDGTVSPFEAAYAYKGMASSTFLVYFLDGTVKAYDTLPQDLDLGTIEKILILSPDAVENFDSLMEELLALAGSNLLVVFKDGTIRPYDEVPEDLDLSSVSRILVLDMDNVEDYAQIVEDLLSLTGVNILVVFKDGTVIPYDTLPEDLDMSQVNKVILFNIESVNDFGSSFDNLDMNSYLIVVSFKDGTVKVFDSISEIVDMSGVGRVTVFNKTYIESFESVTKALSMLSEATVLVRFSNGEVVNFNAESGSGEMISEGRTIVLVIGNPKEFLSTIEVMEMHGNGNTILFSEMSVSDFGNGTISLEMRSELD